MTTPPTPPADEVPEKLLLVFAPIHKRAMGVAFGVLAGMVVFLATVVMILHGGSGYPLTLLREYFFGYSVTWSGAFVGLLWGCVVGFVFGWFFAFCRNLAIALWLFIARTREELSASRDFIDHI